jgi:hypothetical protein
MCRNYKKQTLRVYIFNFNCQELQDISLGQNMQESCSLKRVRHIPDDVDNDEAKHPGSIIYKIFKQRVQLVSDEKCGMLKPNI